jgi:adenosylhomocysteinase
VSRPNFRRIVGQLSIPGRRPTVVLVTHLLPERPLFVTATARLASLAAVLPKPKSADPAALAEVAQIAPCDTLDRHRLAQADQALAYLESRASGQDLVILDVGGYFAPALGVIRGTFSGRILGVVEDTEDGLRRYLTSGRSSRRAGRTR